MNNISPARHNKLCRHLVEVGCMPGRSNTVIVTAVLPAINSAWRYVAGIGISGTGVMTLLTRDSSA